MLTKGERTKQKILKVIAEMFWKNSYHNVSIDKIVERAEVNKASFYQYFKNKEHAGLEAIEHMFESTKEYVFEASFKNQHHPIKRLEEIFTRIYQTHRDAKKEDGFSPGCPFVNMGNELATESELIRSKVENIFKEFYGYHQTIYVDAKAQGLTDSDWEPKIVGRHIQTILNGAMNVAKIRNRPEDILEAITVAKAVIGVPITIAKE